ncbi:MAG: mitochondrial fission ELM1 family protein [Rhodospirillales bacterium]|nr:mitochondrial fission ELM1 family protein [Rhodospirillales bacterium]MDP6774070.1 mitochondrial fission ELM1 family protein [Rhodospirillales bacterium]
MVWALVDDRPGNASQCLGVAEALGLGFQVKDLTYRAAGALPNAALGASFVGLTAASREGLTPPWPDVVVAAGRRTGPVARQIKRLSGGAALLAQIMFPGRPGIAEYDLVSVPHHDRVAARPNVMRITGAPHRVTEQALREAAAEWQGRLGGLPRPRIALMVGGSTRRRRFTEAMARQLGGAANALAATAGGALLVSTSRRSGPAAAAALVAEITVPSHIYRWGDGGDNPYAGYLGTADAVIVTGDSVSMCSEACTTPGPVYIYAPEALTAPKHGRFHQGLFEGGYARPLAGRLEEWRHESLNAAHDIAREIRRRIGA